MYECFPAQTPGPFYLELLAGGHPWLDWHRCLIVSLHQGDLLGTFYRWGKQGLAGLGPPGHTGSGGELNPSVSISQVRAPPITAVPTWAAAVPMQEAAWGQRETPDLLADLALCSYHQPTNVSVHRITTPWSNWLPSRTYQAGWCCCLSRHTASLAKGTGRWR